MIQGILEDQERKALWLEVAGFVSANPARLGNVIPQIHALRIRTDPAPMQYAWQIVNYCEMSAWMEDPALIISLLAEFKLKQIFADALERIQASAPPAFHIPPRIWDPILVNLNLPFLNRAITRQAVECFFYPLEQTIDPAPGIRVLVVNGGERSGKSFTSLYIGYIRRFMGDLNFITISIDLRLVAAARFGAEDLTRLILDQLNPNWVQQQVAIPKATEEQRSIWINNLCKTVVGQLAVMNTKCIVIIDGLDNRSGSQPLPAESVDMIIALAAIATGEKVEPDNNDRLRLVLLGFEQPITNYRNRVRVDPVKPLERADFEQYFTAYANFYNKTVDPAGLQDLVDAVLQDNDPVDPDRTKKLAQKALAIAVGIFNS